jgi:hypothetical protein
MPLGRREDGTSRNQGEIVNAKPKPEVYLLHFDKPYWLANGPCTHCLGYAHYGAEKRIQKHREGNGALLVAYALRNGCDFELARRWPFKKPSDAKAFERRQKKSGHFSRLCPVCKKEKARYVGGMKVYQDKKGEGND